MKNEHASAFGKEYMSASGGKSRKQKRREHAEKIKQQELQAAKADPTGNLMEAYNLKYGSAKDKQKAAGNLALNLLFPFAGLIKKAQKHRRDKKHKHDMEKQKDAANSGNKSLSDMAGGNKSISDIAKALSSDGCERGIMLNDCGDCL